MISVDFAATSAAAAFRDFASQPESVRARFLREIADGIERLGDELVACVNRETALPVTRITGECARTCMQLRLFADVAEQGTWADVRTDAADPRRTPPKPQVRSSLRPIGPAAIFAASNFPLAFSVAGGDTAAALAVGCPVVLKSHPAHPDTSALVGRAVAEAVEKCALPAGTFSLLLDGSHECAMELARHPAIKVGAFTGSLQGGLALWRAAQQRDEPIPFFAEMGSINPVFMFPDALERNADDIAAGLHASMTLGVGQFCTQPGVIFLMDDAAGRAFAERLANLVAATPAGEMLSDAIRTNYVRALGARAQMKGVKTLAGVTHPTDPGRAGGAALLATEATTFQAHPELAEEVFGPASLVVWCSSAADYVHCARSLGGQLTATVWSNVSAGHADLLWELEQKAGRIIFNGFPTGLEVGAATMHGGPYPATTDSRFTSVGTRSLHRFVRPVAWQTPAA